MGGWTVLLAIGFGLIFLGLTTHWSLIVLGAALPFVPVVAALMHRRRNRRTSSRTTGGGNKAVR
jgi:hypothetical protein